MTTIKRPGARFIAWKSGTDLKVYFSDNESKINRRTNVPIHRPLGIRDGHISMDTLPNMGHK